MDSCIFNKTVKGKQCTVVVYVDDLFITAQDRNMIEALEDILKKSFKELTVHDGLVHSYLGMTWDFTVPQQVKITMEHFISSLLEEVQVSGIVKTPATDNLFITRETRLLDETDTIEFHFQVAKLLYLSKRTRPDILLAVSFLTTRVQKPDIDDYHKHSRVLKYINGSKDLGVILRAESPLKLHAYIDASYGVHQDGKGYSALALTLGQGSILAKSSKQKLVTKSSTEAELVAESDFASEAIYSTEFLLAHGEDISPAIIHQDYM
jgi:histone deacetylase 1/2